MAVNTAVLSNVYNYYQVDLVPRSSSNRFDSHKKKDLQDIYKSIVKISKDEPVFLMDRSKDVEEYTINKKQYIAAVQDYLDSFFLIKDQRR